MKTKLFIYSLPVLLFAMMLYGYRIQDHPANINKSLTKESLQANPDNIPVAPTSAGLCTYTWAAQTSGTTNSLLTVSAVSKQIGWAAGVGPTVVRTLNGGTTWTDATGTGISGDVYNIYGVDGLTALCTTTPGLTFIYKTIDGGVTWTEVFRQTGGFIDAIQMISPTEGYAVGDPVDGTWTILKTTDGGDSLVKDGNRTNSGRNRSRVE